MIQREVSVLLRSVRNWTNSSKSHNWAYQHFISRKSNLKYINEETTNFQ
jgi:hypothetical protein